MILFPNNAKLCSKKPHKQPHRTSIYKLTRANFKCRTRRREGGKKRSKRKKHNWLGAAKNVPPGFHLLVKLSRIEGQESERSVGIP